jgi:hypothetical protein
MSVLEHKSWTLGTIEGKAFDQATKEDIIRLAAPQFVGAQCFYIEKCLHTLNSKNIECTNGKIELLGSYKLSQNASIFEIVLAVTNTGSSTWMCDGFKGPGSVNIGVKLISQDGVILHENLARFSLLQKYVLPAERLESRVVISEYLRNIIGENYLVFELVAENIFWFGTKSSDSRVTWSPNLIT